jgi:hypothetical protein
MGLPKRFGTTAASSSSCRAPRECLSLSPPDSANSNIAIEKADSTTLEHGTQGAAVDAALLRHPNTHKINDKSPKVFEELLPFEEDILNMTSTTEEVYSLQKCAP